MPDSIPKLQVSVEDLKEMTYQDIAYAVMKEFLTDFTEEELKTCIANAYDSKFDTEEIAPIVKAGDVDDLELFHGSTIAFKDMALSILPHLLVTSAKKNHVENEIVILTATSGDTGKAALAGFADVPGTKIIVFYPKSGVSPIQEKQMLTQKGENTYVIGIKGNFDDAQTGVKKDVLQQGTGRSDGWERISVFICKLNQHRTSGSSDRILRKSLRGSGEKGCSKGRRSDECRSAYRKLWKYSGSVLCKTDGNSDRKVCLCVQ